VPAVPGVRVPAVLVPAALVPAALDPAVLDPAVLVPAVLVPAVLDPAVLVPAVLVPAVLVPAVLVPAVPAEPVPALPGAPDAGTSGRWSRSAWDGSAADDAAVVPGGTGVEPSTERLHAESTEDRLEAAPGVAASSQPARRRTRTPIAGKARVRRTGTPRCCGHHGRYGCNYAQTRNAASPVTQITAASRNGHFPPTARGSFVGNPPAGRLPAIRLAGLPAPSGTLDGCDTPDRSLWFC